MEFPKFRVCSIAYFINFFKLWPLLSLSVLNSSEWENMLARLFKALFFADLSLNYDYVLYFKFLFIFLDYKILI